MTKTNVQEVIQKTNSPTKLRPHDNLNRVIVFCVLDHKRVVFQKGYTKTHHMSNTPYAQVYYNRGSSNSRHVRLGSILKYSDIKPLLTPLHRDYFGKLKHRKMKAKRMKESQVICTDKSHTWAVKRKDLPSNLNLQIFNPSIPMKIESDLERFQSLGIPLDFLEVNENRNHVRIQADLVKWGYQNIMNHVCTIADIKPEDILIVWASPPCETFSKADSGNFSKLAVSQCKGHGCNYRNPYDPLKGPCCNEENCKYRRKAVEHDQFLPMLKNMIAYDRMLGRNYQFVFENPVGCMRRRPYAQLSAWPSEVSVCHKTVDYCAYGHRYRKSTDLWTSLTNWQPHGTTGSGRCERKCIHGRFQTNPDTGYRSFSHPHSLATAYRDGPSGGSEKVYRQKCSVPTLLHEEILKQAQQATQDSDVVVDLFSGFECLKETCDKFGLRYIGVDIKRHRQ